MPLFAFRLLPALFLTPLSTLSPCGNTSTARSRLPSCERMLPAVTPLDALALMRVGEAAVRCLGGWRWTVLNPCSCGCLPVHAGIGALPKQTPSAPALVHFFRQEQEGMCAACVMPSPPGGQATSADLGFRVRNVTCMGASACMRCRSTCQTFKSLMPACCPTPSTTAGCFHPGTKHSSTGT